MGVNHYENHHPAEEGVEAYVVEVYEDGTRQRVSSVQDAYLAWRAAGNEAIEVTDPPQAPPPAVGTDGGDALAAVRESVEALAAYARENPEAALPIVEGLREAVVGGGASDETHP